MSYSAYDHDKLEATESMRIERRIYFEESKADISGLAALSMEQLQAMREESAAQEQAIFEGLKKQAAAWEEQAGKTLLISKAIAYARTPPVKHTANEWEQRENGHFSRSNMVYQMNYHISENTRYDREAGKSVPYSYTLTWNVRTNGADGYSGAKIAGQTRKVFADKADMEKYLNGRIKAYQHLFTEISPPIPQEYADHFKVSGYLLPGYTIEGEQPPQQQTPQTEQTAQPQETATPQEAQTAQPQEAPPQAEGAPKQEAPAPEPPSQQAAQAAAEPPQPVPVNPIVLTSEKQADKLKEITDRLEQGITQLFESERYKEYLRVMSKFHNYSFNNTLLIAMQKPDASLVAGFSAWKNNFQRNVVKGEKGIKIIAPSPFKIKQEMEKIDPQTRKPVIGTDGKPVMEEKEITIPAYKVVSVFDVSQTEGKELPDIAVDELTGSVEQYEDFFAALEKTSPVPIGFEKIEGGAHGYYHLEEKRIAIDEGMSQLQTLKTAIHEVAHAKLHDIDLNAPKEEQQNRPDRRTREVEAESVAYTVCQHYGLDTSDYSFGYVARWSSGKELSELKSSLETIRAAAAEIINSIDGHIAELQKAREAQREAAAPEVAPEAAPDLAAEPTVTVLWSESGGVQDGQTMRLSEADKLFASLDAAKHAEHGGVYYDKTSFRIDYVMNGEAHHYEGRQDFGDGDGGLIGHIEKYHAYYADNPDWDNYLLRNEGKEALEADKAQREMLLHEFVPYLKLHCNLADMEQAAQRAMRAENLSPTEAAFYDAMQKHVAECRGMLNQGDYDLPPVPRLADFDPDLQAYKQHVMDEIAQEAASAGMTVEEYAANGYEPYAPTQTPAADIPQQGDTFTIYQLKGGDETRDFRFEPYDRLQAAGLAVDPANYEQTYTAPLAPDMTLDSIFEKFNIDRPADFTGHSLSVSDVVVLHQNGQDAAHYVDRFGFKEVPEFLQEQQQVLTPDDHLTGEQITTPRGSFYLTDMSREQMEAAGYGFHHNSDDGKYAIMGNGTRAFAISTEPQQRENPLKAAEQTTEQNYNMIDEQINNTPTVGEIEARAKAGEQISLSDLADAIKADKERGGKTPKSRSSKKPEQKPSIRAQLAAAKEQAKEQPKKQPEKSKGKEMEV